MRADQESQTAVLVCAGRAAAHGRTPVAAFADPTAEPLLPAEMRVRVQEYRAGRWRPDSGPERLEYGMLRACEGLMVPRTVAIDDAVRAGPAGQLVILGAGLDGRAWRLPGLAGTVVFEVDHPASQQAKRTRAAALTPQAAEIRFVPVDFARDSLDGRLAGAGHDAAAPTTWVWEGVIPYLTRDQIRSTLAVVAARSAPGSRLVVAYLAPSLVRALGRLAARQAARRGGRDILGDEPQRSFHRPPALRALLARYGFAVHQDRDVVQILRDLPAPTTGLGAFARANRIAVADRRT